MRRCLLLAMEATTPISMTSVVKCQAMLLKTQWGNAQSWKRRAAPCHLAQGGSASSVSSGEMHRALREPVAKLLFLAKSVWKPVMS